MMENQMESSQFSNWLKLEIAAIGRSKIMIRNGKTIMEPTNDMTRNIVGFSKM